MAHWQRGNTEEARRRYDRGVEQMARNEEHLTPEWLHNLRVEGARLLAVKDK
jgi:hypothetical protein